MNPDSHEWNFEKLVGSVRLRFYQLNPRIVGTLSAQLKTLLPAGM